ncbi:MAG: aminotransferase class III-fold pyridoxal phosphate-dependent enzyme [Clostridium sp.]|nr:aminotransferase class III-fold pyridoxal phosphate-dependent enzyme [Clostridium sp.]
MFNDKNLLQTIKRVSIEKLKGIRFIKSKDNEKFISYKQLYKNSLTMLGNMQRLGIKPKDKIIFQVDDNEKFISIFWTCILGGMVSVPISVPNNDEQCVKLFNIVNSINDMKIVGNKILLDVYKNFAIKNNLQTDYEKINKNFIDVKDLYENNDMCNIYDSKEDDVAVIQFSSGSTGIPKGVMLTHHNLISNVNSVTIRNNLTENDSVLTWLPLTHDMGLILCHIMPIINNMNQYNIETSDFIKNPLLWMHIASKYKATILQSPNFGYKHLMSFLQGKADKDWDLSAVRVIYNGAEPISEKVCNEFLNEMEKYNLDRKSMTTGYGLAECTVVATVCETNAGLQSNFVDRRFLKTGEKIKYIEDENNVNSIGIVNVGEILKDNYIKITDENGVALEEEVIGFIKIKGESVTKGYYNNNKLTEEAIDQDGWLNTFDLGFLSNKKLFITGRAKDVIIVNGQNYYSYDIERIISEIEGMSSYSFTVCGTKDSVTSSDSLVIFVIYDESLDKFKDMCIKIKKYLNFNLGLKVKYIIPVKDVPKTESGKVQRFKLKQLYEEGAYQDILNSLLDQKAMNKESKKKANDSIYNIIKSLIGIVKDTLGVDKVSEEDSLFEIGVNSLILSQIKEKINILYPVNIDVTDFFTYPTIVKLANYIKGGKIDTVQEEKSDMKEEPMAIVGMACKLPMSNNLEEYWNNIVNKIDCVRDFPQDRKKDIDEYLSCKGVNIENLKYEQGGYLDEIDKFDNKFFKVIPKEAIAMSPSQRMFLETAWEAMEDAGCDFSKLKGSRTGIYIGYIGDLEGYKYNEILDESSNEFTATGALTSVAGGRLAHFMDFRGPCILVDTACSSSLIAIHMACQGIRNGDCEQALVGGIKLKIAPVINNNKLVGTESKDFRARTFDNKADGTGEGEGVEAIFVKPLSKAIADRDNIYSVIKGSAINQDGNSMGISAPNPVAQTDVIVNAWKKAGINPSEVQYIEAHGTGTKIGDPIEIKALTNAFEKYTNKKQFCAIGSVKPNISHLYEASGLASIIKVSLALKKKVIPPTANFTEPNENIEFCDSPFFVSLKKREWEKKNGTRIAGVSAFGFSGTNCHIVLEEPKENYGEGSSVKDKIEVFTVSAKSEKSLSEIINKYKVFFGRNKDLNIADVCYTSNIGRENYDCRAVFLIKDLDELCEKLNEFSFETNKSQGIYYENNSANLNNKLKNKQINKLNEECEEILLKLNTENKISYDQLYMLCMNYVKGAKVNWNSMYINREIKKVSLPTYAFDNKRFWPKLDIYKAEYKKERSGIKDMSNENYTNNNQVVKNEIEEFLKDSLIKVTGMTESDINVYDNLIELGLDSMTLNQLRNAIKNKFNVDIPLVKFFDTLTDIDSISEFLNTLSLENKVNQEEGKKIDNLTKDIEPKKLIKENNEEKPVSEIKTMKSVKNVNEKDSNLIRSIINKQLDTISALMEKQLDLASNYNLTVEPNDIVGLKNIETSIVDKDTKVVDKSERKVVKENKKVDFYVPYKHLDLKVKEEKDIRKVEHLNNLINEYTRKTKLTKEKTQKYRHVYSNNRNIAGFRPDMKEMVYQIIAQRGQGSKLWDIDGNEYVDLTMGFGVNLFGHNPSFVNKALQEELKNGMPIGPMGRLAGEVAQGISDLTGVERVAFYNSGTEAVMVALRIARAASNKSKVAIFLGSYHGTYDGVLGIPDVNSSENLAVPLASGILKHAVQDIILLNYNDPKSLEIIKENADELAAVIVETVQSRRPDLQPKEFLHQLREVTEGSDVALIFDEIVTGFRICKGGAQEHFGVKADIVTYGKVIGGGMPIGVVAGKAKYMDCIDGGMWQYGDDSYPADEDKRTFVAGTFCHHPLAMAAAKAVIDYIKENGDSIYSKVNGNTKLIEETLNEYFNNNNIPIKIVRFGSLFRFVFNGDFEVLFYHLLNKGIYVWEGRNCFISTEHTSEDIEKIIKSVKESVEEMREAGYFNTTLNNKVNDRNKRRSYI